MVREHIGRDPRCRAMFVFFGNRRSAVKMFFYDGTGLCQFYKRLDRGNFRLPEPRGEGEPYVELGERDLDELLDGINLDKGSPKKPTPRLYLMQKKRRQHGCYMKYAEAPHVTPYCC
jgi:transposase